MSNRLDQKITFIIDGTSEIGKEIVRSFLLENATVIVSACNKSKIMQLEEYVKDIPTGKLISFLTNTHFEKKSMVSEVLKRLFLRIDLILTVLENDAKEYSFFTDVEINDIQKTLKNDAWPCLICSQIFLTHGRKTSCMYIAVTQNSNQKSNKPLDRFLLNVQTQIAELISEETDQIKTNYYHLFLNDEVIKNGKILKGSNLAGQYILDIFLEVHPPYEESFICL